ncbi:MAG: hypothetical protein K2X57_06645 [Xanthobacteraceae bacterium]|nr:hypothetical protein [Xanthobacteraceae bacterium]
MAMAGVVSFRDDAQPVQTVRSMSRWLIVSLWGDESQFLTIALSNTSFDSRTGWPRKAPIGIASARTLLAIRSASRTERPSEFSLTRELPASLATAGSFLPLDGYVYLDVGDTPWRLSARGRMGPGEARRLFATRCFAGRSEIAPGQAFTWQADAQRVPWEGDRIVGAGIG